MNGGSSAGDADRAARSAVARRTVAVLCGVVVLQLLRQRGVPSWDTIWVEDGPVYVGQANERGAIAVLLHGYAGYLQLLSRLLAVPTAFLPVSWIAAYLAVSSAIVTTLLAGFVYRSTGGWIATTRVRLAVGAIAALGPAAAIETTATVTNVIWPLLAAAPWAFASRRRSGSDVAMRATVAFLAATSTLLSAVFVPLAIGALVRRRARADLVVALTFAAGLVIQLLVVTRSTFAETSDRSVRMLVDLFGLRVLGSFLVGERPLDDLWSGIGEPAVVVFVVVTVAIFALLLPGAGRANQTLAATFLAVAVITFAAPVWARGTEVIGFALGTYTWNMTRYTLAPILMLVSAVAVLADPVGPERARRVAVRARPALVVQTAVVVAIGLFTWTLRSEGPGWVETSSLAYEEQCTADRAGSARITTSPTNFSVVLPCDRLAP